MTLDLQDLRIDHEKETRAARGGSRVWMVLFFILLLVSAAAVLYLLEFRPTRGGEVEVRVERVVVPGAGSRGGRSDATGAFSAAGWIKVPRYHPVFVTPLTAGRLDEIKVIEGDRVTRGQVIARLYDGDFRSALEVSLAAERAAQAELEKREAGFRPQEVAEARAEVDRLDAELATAREILNHSRKLHPSGAIPLEELQKDEMKVATVVATRAKALERYKLMQEGFRREDIALAGAARAKTKAERELAELQLGYATVKSPMDGRVLERMASAGQWVTPAEGKVVSLYDPTDLEARVDVNQDDIGKVYVGQRVEVSTRAEPQKIYPARVVLLEPLADETKNIVRVRAKLEISDGELLYPQMVVKARFLAKSTPAAKPKPGADAVKPKPITVPVVAVARVGEATWVLLVESGRLVKRQVTLGKLANGRYAVTRGLEGGEQVVVSGTEGLSPGAAVRVAP